MAIDTAEKRRTASGIKRLGARVTPNAAKDADWRRQVGWNYFIQVVDGVSGAENRRAISGILPIFAVGVTPNASQDLEWRQEAGWGYPQGTPPARTGADIVPLIARRRRMRRRA